MNVSSPLTPTTAQVWGAKQDLVRPKSPFLAGKAQILSGMSGTVTVASGRPSTGTWTGMSGTVTVSSGPSTGTWTDMSGTVTVTSGSSTGISGTWTGIAGTCVVVAEGKVVEQETFLKERALALIRKDKSIPTNLHLKRGTIKELDDGVFVKRKLDGVLEIYVSEE
jgi:hypothetical protein